MSKNLKKTKAIMEADGSVTVRFSKDAVIRRYMTSAVLVMPRHHGYDSYRYMVDINCFKDFDLGNDVEVHLCTSDTHTLTIRRRGTEAKLTAEDVYKVFSKATPKDFVLTKLQVTIPTKNVQGNYPNMIRCKLTNDSAFKGQHIVIPSIYKDTENSTETQTVFSIPDYVNFSLRDENGDDKLINVVDLIDMGVI